MLSAWISSLFSCQFQAKRMKLTLAAEVVAMIMKVAQITCMLCYVLHYQPYADRCITLL